MPRRCQTCLELLEESVTSGNWGHVTIRQVRTAPAFHDETVWYDSFRWSLNPSRSNWCVDRLGEYFSYDAHH